jgi:enterochelin esterase family protein
MALRRLVVLLFLLVLSQPAGADTPFASLSELEKSIQAVESGGDAEALWRRVLAHRTMPLIFDQTAVFFWRGDAGSLEWRGDFNLWKSTEETRGKRIGNSNIRYLQRSFPRDARLDYKIVLNGQDWQVDPLNPHQQLGGFGPNSEVRMPDWKPSPDVVPRKEIPHGQLSGDIAFKSVHTGYSINYRVYTPPGFDPATSGKLPVLYVTDGSDYWNDGMGGLVIILDNLIADRRIAPLLAVFIDPWDREANENRREKELVPAADRSCKFCEFLAAELIPAIDKSYPTGAAREHRAILGTSLGGLHSTLMANRYGSLFGLIAIQSPAYFRTLWVLEESGNADPLPIKAFINAGIFEGEYVNYARTLRDIWQQKKVSVRYMELNEGHSWGHWRAVLDDMLEYFFPPGKMPG